MIITSIIYNDNEETISIRHTCKNSIQDSLEIRKRYKTIFRDTARSTPDQSNWTSDVYMQWTGERQVYSAMRMHLLSSEAKLARLCRRKNAGNMR